MGFEVAKALSDRGGWQVHLLDMNEERGEQAAKQIGASFHKTNVLEYDSLAAVFQNVFDASGQRLDFVYANAGIVERFNFYETHPAGRPPPPPDQTVIDINLKAVINTSWLAQHYFRQSKQSLNPTLVMTASVGGLYRCQVSPSYCAAKHGVVGFMRSIAAHYYAADNIRVNAICPGTVKTGLLDAAAWATFSDDVFVPIEKISAAVLMLIDGYDAENKLTQSNGHTSNGVKSVHGSAAGEKLWGKAVELSGSEYYFRDQVPFSDDHMARCMQATDRTSYDA